MTLLYLLLLAHLVADFMQPASLVRWTKESVQGLIVHTSIYSLITALVIAAYSPIWWFWAALLGVSHFVIDYHLDKGRLPFTNLSLLVVDQVLHLLMIGAIFWSGLRFLTPIGQLTFLSDHSEVFRCLVGYVAATFGGSIFVFEAGNTFYPQLPSGGENEILSLGDRCLGITERALTVTFILLGRYLLIPLAFLPSMAVRRKELRGGQRPRLLCELAISLLIALAVGFWLRFG
ncbi:MAG: DUF3307 domain-containing protein [Methanocellales archaeon]|nr:DUF3307 domain-containing protein [Methanocellales archaeon]